MNSIEASLPEGVLELVQGWGATGRALCTHPDVRSVCFTGSVPVGKALAQELAADYSKSLALELGGRNAMIVFSDADLDRAADAAADGICLTAGQRCNSTSRIFVQRDVEERFISKLLDSLRRYIPGYPVDDATMLGPLASERALQRYENVISRPGKWLLRGEICPEVSGRRGYYVRPALLASREDLSLGEEEIFAPFATVEFFGELDEAMARHAATPFGLTASVFTKSQETFRLAGEHLEVGNLYRNLPTTFSPSTLPFGGFRASGNGKPGARGFVRFAADEQAVQWTA